MIMGKICKTKFSNIKYINNSFHLARKYTMIFVGGHYLFREANSFPRAWLEENCEQFYPLNRMRHVVLRHYVFSTQNGLL